MSTRLLHLARCFAVALLAGLPLIASAQILQGFSIHLPPAAKPAPAVGADKFRTVPEPVVGRYLVVLRPSVAKLSAETASTSPTVAVVAADITATHGGKVMHAYERVLRGFAIDADDETLARLLADPRVEYVQEDGVVRGAATQTNAPWGLDRVDQRNLPLTTTYTYDGIAANVRAYILDSGLYSGHADFQGRIGKGISTVTGLPQTTEDCHGHGTHVAGTLGGSRWGVAKGVTLHPVRVLNCNNSGLDSDLIAGLDWVAAKHIKPAVANLSLQGYSWTTGTAVDALIDSGVVVVAAAGNFASDACNSAPGRVPNAITVASTTITDQRSSFSNFGTCVDLFAPGSDILSASIAGPTASVSFSGTSMATPHVAGAAALHLSTHPNATPAQVAAALIANATPDRVTDAGPGSPNRLLYIPNGSVAPPANQPFRPEFSGAWYNPETSGQGQMIEVNADLGVVFGGWYTHDANGQSGSASQRWYTFQGTYSPGDTVRTVPVYRNTGGNFDAPPITTAVPVGSATLSFQSCSSARLQYQVDLDGQTRTGTIPLSRLDTNPYCASGGTPTYSLSQQGISPGINGAWYEPATSGQGMQIMALPFNGNQLFITWFTYEVNGETWRGANGQRWFTIQGGYTPGSAQAFNLPIYRTTGGRFDTPPPAPPPTQVGTASIIFHSCTSASLTYSFFDGRPGRTIPLNRLTGANCAP
jgi:subtilisin family serine protease